MTTQTTLHSCDAPSCGRQFLDVATLRDHADAVHTFDDIRTMVCEALRAKFGDTGASPGVTNGPTYLWVVDLADDWVVFQRETADGTGLYKSSYVIDSDGMVTLGDPAGVQRRTVYEPVKTAS